MASDIRDGMARALWSEAWERHQGRASVAPATPPAADTAARDLEKLYEKMNGVMSLDTILANDESDLDPTDFGYWLAKISMGIDVPWMSPRHIDRIRIPNFAAVYDGTDLTWDGDDGPRSLSHPPPRSRRVNPTNFDRDDAREWGREAHRMGITAAQAVQDARRAGVPERLLGDVADGWGHERSVTVHHDYYGNPDRKRNPTDAGTEDWYEISWSVNQDHQPDPEGTGTNRGMYPRSEVEPMLRWLQQQGIHDGLRRVRLIRKAHTKRNPTDVSGGLGQKPHVKTVAETRQILAARKAKCHPRCQGWEIFNEHEGRPEIQVCDECMSELPKAVRLSDDDVAQLAEAQTALREAQARTMEENPRGTFTDKGERLYQEVKDSYRGDPRADEIAARTVYARAADGVPGLIVRHGRPPGVPNRSR